MAYKNHGNCIYQLMDWIFEHYKFIQISSFIFLNHTRACTEATHKISEFLELWLFFYKFPKIQHYSKSENIKTLLFFSFSHWQPDPTRQWHIQVTAVLPSLAGPKRADGDTPTRQTVPKRSTPSYEPILALRSAEGAPEKAPCRPWRLGHDGARHNPGNGE